MEDKNFVFIKTLDVQFHGETSPSGPPMIITKVT